MFIVTDYAALTKVLYYTSQLGLKKRWSNFLGRLAGKGLTSLLSFVLSYCEVVTFPLVSWVRCGAWLYWFLIFALCPTLSSTSCDCMFQWFWHWAGVQHLALPLWYSVVVIFCFPTKNVLFLIETFHLLFPMITHNLYKSNPFIKLCLGFIGMDSVIIDLSPALYRDTLTKEIYTIPL